MNDDFLNRWRKTPSPEFSKALYKRISQPMTEKTINRRLTAGRLAGALAALILIVAFTLALSPAARAQAGELVRQIGPFSFFDRSGESQRAIPSAAIPEPTAEPPSGNVAEMADSAALAAEISGFRVYEPLELPEGFKLVDGWTVMPQASGTVVVSFYSDAAGHFLGINQYRFGPTDHWDQSYGQNETVREIDVRGQSGVAVSGRYMTHPIEAGQSQVPELLETNWLIWAEDGVAYTLLSDSLTIEALIAVAESMR
jgi:hypothetical protein